MPVLMPGLLRPTSQGCAARDPRSQQNQCAFIGLGEMGRRMATNMAKAGAQGGYPPLIVWNRSQDNVDEFKTWAKEHGVEDSAYKAVDSIADVVKEWVVLHS